MPANHRGHWRLVPQARRATPWTSTLPRSRGVGVSRAAVWRRIARAVCSHGAALSAMAVELAARGSALARCVKKNRFLNAVGAIGACHRARAHAVSATRAVGSWRSELRADCGVGCAAAALQRQDVSQGAQRQKEVARGACGSHCAMATREEALERGRRVMWRDARWLWRRRRAGGAQSYAAAPARRRTCQRHPRRDAPTPAAMALAKRNK